MNDKIVEFPGQTKGHIAPDKILKAARGKLKEVLVIGLCSEGDDIYYGYSTGEAPTITWLLERAKFDLLHDHE